MCLCSAAIPLSYADVEKLTAKDISRGLDGEYWIFTDRTKTGNASNVPLLPQAIKIIDKYKEHPVTINSERLLPVISNQKMNAYLKELATLCEINKRMTFHMARHTFATTVTLSNGVSIGKLHAWTQEPQDNSDLREVVQEKDKPGYAKA